MWIYTTVYVFSLSLSLSLSLSSVLSKPNCCFRYQLTMTMITNTIVSQNIIMKRAKRNFLRSPDRNGNWSDEIMHPAGTNRCIEKNDGQTKSVWMNVFTYVYREMQGQVSVLGGGVYSTIRTRYLYNTYKCTSTYRCWSLLKEEFCVRKSCSVTR